MIELLTRRILGDPMAVPSDLPEGLCPADVKLRRGALVPGIGGFLARMRRPAAAVTLGRTIVVHPNVRLTPALLAHELTHVRQWREVPLFPLRYILATFRYGYTSNPFEVEARACAAASATITVDTTSE